ncbi:hypothetical protein [Granulicella paludicola]|uniref:hypothetical protein n=1 Tax=Granulicella paludicola TaxID=474951 RepID=UPI0021DF50A9|nr:hypothetical protein [Granulicella paludicola]
MYQNHESALETERTQAAELSSRTHMKALGYENLYYASQGQGGNSGYYLHLAAEQLYQGRVGMMATSPQDKKSVTETLGKLRSIASNVSDLPSFNAFMDQYNKVVEDASGIEVNGLIDAGHSATHFFWFYLSLYVIGTVLALVGQAIEPL